MTLALASAILAFAPSATTDIAYGKDPLQRLDVYATTLAKDAPVLVIVHGGGWRAGSKDQMLPLARNFNAHGVTVVTVDYRLAPANMHPAASQDVAASLAWVRDHIGSYGGDPKRIHVLGHSAGAHLVALVGTDPAYLAAHKMKLTDLAGIYPIDTASYDLVDSRRRLTGMIEAAFGTDEAVLRSASPLNVVTKSGHYPPFLIAYCASREATVGGQSKRLEAALREAGGKAETISMPGKTHATIMRDLAKPSDSLFKKILGWIKR